MGQKKWRAIFGLDDKEIEDHGRNRRTSKESKGSADQEPDHGPGGSGAQGTNQGTGWTFSPYQGAGKSSSLIIDWDELFGSYPIAFANVGGDFCPCVDEDEMVERRRRNKWAPPWMAGELGKPNAAKHWCPRLRAAQMQSEGVIAGEIIAWRAWHWNGKALRSLFVDYEWPIKGPAVGYPNRGYGIHAFKTLPRTIAEYHSCLNDVILGEVALWGDVIEHEGGYLAEFAKVHSLRDAPQHVKALYGIE